MTKTDIRSPLMTVLAVCVTLLIGWFAYQPALSGTFTLDDQSNLADLQHVEDSASALHFALSGTAGPSGRPLALASFLPQADAWDNGAASFLAVNILIHLLNGCLLFGFLYQLARFRGMPQADVRYVAVAATALWLLLPLLASSSLMVVQRMTTLSASFILLGLNVYLMARGLVARNANAGLGGMSAALAVATLLAVLTKESGALLPVLVLVIEATVLLRPQSVPGGKWKIWKSVFLLLPTALIIGYLGTRVPYADGTVLQRGFGGWERLLSEARILWEYLFNAFFARPGQYGPYHDGYPVAESLLEPATFLAVAGWVAQAVCAQFWRRTHPIFAFAILWFLGGHLLESTTVPLELYFEHRNYVPMIGPVFAFCHVVVAVPEHYRNLARGVLPLFILLNAFVLFSQASLWGDPVLAARYWHERYPNSVRAATAYATQQLTIRGPQATLGTLQEFAARHPQHAYIRIPELNLSCSIMPGSDHRRTVEALHASLPDVAYSHTAGQMLSELFTTVSRRNCSGVDATVVRNLAARLLANPRYAANAGYTQLHHQLMARMARAAGDTDQTLRHLHRAVAIQPNNDLNMMIVTTLASAGRMDQARTYIEEAREAAPLNPLKRYLWQTNLAELRAYVDEIERNTGIRKPPEPAADARTG